MNYYRRYIGDYMRDTATLSVAEHGAYNLLLDHAYATEAPIPADGDEVMRLVRAFTADERRAVQRVLAKFWVLEADGYHNRRVDEEIAAARKLIDRQKANGSKGGRPKETHHETQNEPTGSIWVSSDETLDNQPPSTNHQPPSASHQPLILQPPKVKTVSATAARRPRVNGEEPPTAKTWEAYSAAYCGRYSTDPVRNAKVNGQIKQFVARIGISEAPAVAAFYLGHNGTFYVRAMHDTSLMLRDAEKLRTEWATGHKMTNVEARSAEQVDSVRAQIERVGKRIEGRKTDETT